MGGRVTLMVGLLALVAAAGVQAADPDRGWTFLVDKLERDGIPRDRAERVFRDERVDEFDGLSFSLQPRESQLLYRNLRTRATAGRARLCIAEHGAAFEEAQERYGVPANVVAAIIQVESGCGRNTGRSRILPGLARLAMAAEPENLERNIARHTLLDMDRSETSIASWTRWRGQALEDMFYPEVRATFDIADRIHVDPLEIRGSGSGAFGIPQFLPRSYLWFGVDGDQDGHVDLYDPDDAIPSCAHYLQYYGWRPGLSRSERQNVIWGYNHSDAYINTILWVAGEVGSPTPEPPEKARKAVQLASRRKTTKTTRTATKTTKATTKSKATSAKRRTSTKTTHR
ncbi:MAG TPA: lytic murein transglycosylase [Candidatus Eisenbacteria bacterium]|nr:lytic murein transglycosylase [Candidatus Eisenbacteria bacterium]